MNSANDGAKSMRGTVQILGLLESLHLEGERFTLRLDSGQKVLCSCDQGTIHSLATFFGQRVLVTGVAVWDLSGCLHRIEVDTVRPGGGVSSAYSVLPGPLIPSDLPVDARTPPLKEMLAHRPPWEGEETDEELLQALKKLDG
jgi:hypothetical protein